MFGFAKENLGTMEDAQSVSQIVNFFKRLKEVDWKVCRRVLWERQSEDMRFSLVETFPKCCQFLIIKVLMFITAVT